MKTAEYNFSKYAIQSMLRQRINDLRWEKAYKDFAESDPKCAKLYRLLLDLREKEKENA